MPVSSDNSDWALQAGSATFEEEGTQPHLFAISDAGSSALRIIPDLYVGESADGELTFDAENSEYRWLAFRGDDAGSSDFAVRI